MAANVLSRLAVVITANTAQMVGQLGTANNKLSLMTKSLNTLKNTMLGTFGAYAVLHAIQNTVGALADFDREMTAVSVITGSGKLSRGFQMLERDALRIGGSTRFAAKEVAALQLEFGRLGFSTREILLSTKATVDLATATGESLPRSAEIAGATLRGFNLDASEMGRVTDVMAKALNESALTLDSFADGMKYVAPVAASLNVSIEETSAMLSVLSDAGIKGTMAGTSLRRIFTLLTNDGKPLQDRLQALAKSGITLAQANDEVGLYAQTSLLILTKYFPRLQELAKLMEDAKNETEKMAVAMNQNLDTAIVRVTNSWNAYILSLSSSKGVLKGTADALSDIFKVASDRGLIGTLAMLSPGSMGGINMATAVSEVNRQNIANDRRNKQIQESIERRAKEGIQKFGDSPDGLQKLREAYDANPNTRGQTALDIYNEAIRQVNEGLKKQTEELIKNADAQWENEKAKEESIKHEQELAFLKKQASHSSIFGTNVDPSGISNAESMVVLKSYAHEMGMLPEKIQLATTETEAFSQAQAVLAEKVKMADLKAAGENFKVFEDNTRNLHGALASMASDLGTAFATLGEETRGGAKAVARAAISIINTLEQITLARMIADSSKFGLPGILVAAAGFGVVKGIFARISRGASDGGASGSVASLNQRNFDKGIYVNGEFKLYGSTLVAGIDNYEYQRKRLGG